MKRLLAVVLALFALPALADTTIVTRATKGSPLTYNEVDANFINLKATADGAVTSLAGKQPLDSDLTAIAALSTTSFGRALLELLDASAARTALGLGTSATTAASAYAPATSGTTLLKGDGSGGFSAYGGTSCTNQFIRSLSTVSAATCATVANTDLSNSAITIAGTSTSLGGSITLDAITGLSTTGIIKRTGSNTFGIAIPGTDYVAFTLIPGTPTGSVQYNNGASGISGISGALTDGTTLTLSSPTIDKIANLTSDGCVQVSGSDGTLSTTSCGGGGSVTPSSTDTFTHKTYDTAGTGNSFSINGVAATANTGTGAVVRASSPALTTPDLGTPSALVATNASGTASGLTAGHVTTNANLTGDVTSSGNAATLASTAVTPGSYTLTNLTVDAKGRITAASNGSGGGGGDALTSGTLAQFASTTSAQLAGVISNETGSGALVFATSPALTTPDLGTPSAAVLTNATSIPAGQLTGTVATARLYTTAAGYNITNGATIDSWGGKTVPSGTVVGTSDTQTLTNKSIADSQLTGAYTASGQTMATARLLGRTTASAGAAEEITVGTGLSLSGGALTATGGGGSGTVTNTGGNLTANAVVLGAGTVDSKVVAGVSTDGTSALNLGVAGSSVGKVVLANATSGTITMQPPTGALGTVTVTVPAATDTLVNLAGTQTLTNKSIVATQLTGTVANAQLQKGTSFPGSPSSGDQYFRTDLGLDCYYDGTRWLTKTEYQIPFYTIGDMPATATGTKFNGVADNSQAGMYLTRMVNTIFVNPSNDSTHYWTVQVQWNTAGAVPTNIGSAISTQGLSASSFLETNTTINAALSTTAKSFSIVATKVSTAGTAYIFTLLWYRLIVT